MDSFSDLSQRLRTHICYAHIFGDALTEEQLVARCAPGDPEGVRRELELLETNASVTRDGEYWFLHGAVIARFASIRKSRERAAERVIEDQRKLIGFLKRLGIVRMLAVSGSLGWKNHVDREGKPADLDLFIIAAPSGVHIVRLTLLVRERVRRVLSRFGLCRGWTSACANYVTDIEFLDVTNPSFYTASDALHVQVLKGEDVYREFLGANRWIDQYYPVTVAAPALPSRRGRNPVRAALNIACFAATAGYSWMRARFMSARPFIYSVGFRFDRAVSLRRIAPAGGGYQPVVARRFREVHARHFGPDAALFAFLFPNTTDAGMHGNGKYAEPPVAPTIGRDE